MYLTAFTIVVFCITIFKFLGKNREILRKSSTIGQPLPVLSAKVLISRLVSRLFDRTQDQGYLHEDFISLYRSTGHPIYAIDLFVFKIVVCNDFDTIRQVLLSDGCSDRVIDKSILIRTFNGQEQGILSNNGSSLKETRRYTVKTLGKIGFNSKSGGIAYFVQEQVPELLEHINSLIESTGNKVPVSDLFALSVINVVWSIAGGQQFTRQNHKVLRLMEMSHTISQLTHADLAIINMMAPLIIRYPKVFKYDKVLGAVNLLKIYFSEMVKNRMALGQYEDDPKDFIDHFLLEIDKHKDDTTSKSQVYSFENLVMILVDLFTAGKDTTSNTLEAAIMYMILYPHVQKKIQDEIDIIAGKTEQISYSDHKAKMPYTMATILEVHRMVSVSPLAPRAAGNDSLINNYVVKRGTWMLVNLYALNMDPDFWKDPEIFRPERFLDSENNFIRSQVSHMMPFGGGSRACIGEAVANLSLFTFFTAVLQNYTVQKGDKNEKLSMIFPLTSCPLPFHASFTPR